MTPRIQKAIDIFLDAINEGTLAKGTCTACAVGNLVANGLGIKAKIPTQEDYDNIECSLFLRENTMWSLLVNQQYFPNRIKDTLLMEKSRKNIDATDFSIEELQQIEEAFEYNTTISWSRYKFYSKEEIRTDQIKGSEAVIKVMLTFDNQLDNVKEIFTNKAKLITI